MDDFGDHSGSVFLQSPINIGLDPQDEINATDYDLFEISQPLTMQGLGAGMNSASNGNAGLSIGPSGPFFSQGQTHFLNMGPFGNGGDNLPYFGGIGINPNNPALFSSQATFPVALSFQDLAEQLKMQIFALNQRITNVEFDLTSIKMKMTESAQRSVIQFPATMRALLLNRQSRPGTSQTQPTGGVFGEVTTVMGKSDQPSAADNVDSINVIGGGTAVASAANANSAPDLHSISGSNVSPVKPSPLATSVHFCRSAVGSQQPFDHTSGAGSSPPSLQNMANGKNSSSGSGNGGGGGGGGGSSQHHQLIQSKVPIPPYHRVAVSSMEPQQVLGKTLAEGDSESVSEDQNFSANDHRMDLLSGSDLSNLSIIFVDPASNRELEDLSIHIHPGFSIRNFNKTAITVRSKDLRMLHKKVELQWSGLHGEHIRKPIISNIAGEEQYRDAELVNNGATFDLTSDGMVQASFPSKLKVLWDDEGEKHLVMRFKEIYMKSIKPNDQVILNIVHVNERGDRIIVGTTKARLASRRTRKRRQTDQAASICLSSASFSQQDLLDDGPLGDQENHPILSPQSKKQRIFDADTEDSEVLLPSFLQGTILSSLAIESSSKPSPSPLVSSLSPSHTLRAVGLPPTSDEEGWTGSSDCIGQEEDIPLSISKLSHRLDSDPPLCDNRSGDRFPLQQGNFSPQSQNLKNVVSGSSQFQRMGDDDAKADGLQTLCSSSKTAEGFFFSSEDFSAAATQMSQSQTPPKSGRTVTPLSNRGGSMNHPTASPATLKTEQTLSPQKVTAIPGLLEGRERGNEEQVEEEDEQTSIELLCNMDNTAYDRSLQILYGSGRDSIPKNFQEDTSAKTIAHSLQHDEESLLKAKELLLFLIESDIFQNSAMKLLTKTLQRFESLNSPPKNKFLRAAVEILREVGRERLKAGQLFEAVSSYEMGLALFKDALIDHHPNSLTPPTDEEIQQASMQGQMAYAIGFIGGYFEAKMLLCGIKDTFSQLERNSSSSSNSSSSLNQSLDRKPLVEYNNDNESDNGNNTDNNTGLNSSEYHSYILTKGSINKLRELLIRSLSRFLVIMDGNLRNSTVFLVTLTKIVEEWKSAPDKTISKESERDLLINSLQLLQNIELQKLASLSENPQLGSARKELSILVSSLANQLEVAAGIFFRLAEYRQAKENCSLAMEILQQLPDGNTNQIFMRMFSACIEWRAGNYILARPHLKKCLDDICHYVTAEKSVKAIGQLQTTDLNITLYEHHLVLTGLLLYHMALAGCAIIQARGQEKHTSTCLSEEQYVYRISDDLIQRMGGNRHWFLERARVILRHNHQITRFQRAMWKWEDGYKYSSVTLMLDVQSELQRLRADVSKIGNIYLSAIRHQLGCIALWLKEYNKASTHFKKACAIGEATYNTQALLQINHEETHRNHAIANTDHMQALLLYVTATTDDQKKEAEKLLTFVVNSKKIMFGEESDSLKLSTAVLNQIKARQPIETGSPITRIDSQMIMNRTIIDIPQWRKQVWVK